MSVTDGGYAYKCPECSESSSSKDWNDVTKAQLEIFGAMAIMPIDLCPKEEDGIEYVCPHCYQQSPRRDLKKEFKS